MPIYDRFFADHRSKIGTPEASINLTIGGPLLQVSVSVTEAYAKLLQGMAKPIPNPVSGFALLDTGAAACCIDQDVLTSLGVQQVGFQQTIGATSDIPVNAPTYPASISFPGTNLPNVSFQDFTGLPLATQGIIAIIGRNILRHFILIYHGPAGTLTLAH